MKVFLYLATLHLCNCFPNFPDYRNHPCKRPCNGTSMVCTYNFTLELMFSMEGRHCRACPFLAEDCYRPFCVVCDGKQNMITTINRQIPAPPIEVCKGDEIKVNVQNRLPDQVTTIHWHGQHQKRTPFMDGTPMITQCPINPGTTFQYHFLATEVGTHFYHSHTGFQHPNGVFGSFVVKDTDANNKIRDLYDYDLSEHVLVVNGWISLSPTEHYYSFERLGKLKQVINPILVNGFASHQLIPGPPTPIFKVKKGYRYRFRLIHAGTLTCSITLSVHGHDLTVVSVDGNDIHAQVVDKITITNGERIDFIIKANNPRDNYWMSFQGGYQCASFSSLAALSYDDKLPLKLSSFVPSVKLLEFNCIDKKSNASNCISYMNVKSLDAMEPELKGEPNFKYFIGFKLENYTISPFNDTSSLLRMTPAFNNITFTMPSSNLLDCNSDEISFCNIESLKGCPEKPCECLHMIEIPYNSLSELIFIHIRGFLMFHPIHMHGYNFRVVANEKLDGPVTIERVKRLDRLGLLKRNFNDPPIKDTITTPSEGYSIVRFKANNEGYWFIHCHIDSHAEVGMSMVLKVGNPPKPPEGFPKCGDYVYNVGLKQSP